MLPLAADWATISSLATAAGTLVLAVATFAAVRSSNRSAQLAEIALQEQRRPVLAPSRLNDPLQRLNFSDDVWVAATGGHAAVRLLDGRVYLGLNLRNVGSGIGVCQGWAIRPRGASNYKDHVPLEEMTAQQRDLYVPAGDNGMWQAALRRPDDPARIAIAESIAAREPLTVELLYSDLAGLQRTITRFALHPEDDTHNDPHAEDARWALTMTRHWFLDWSGPRPDAS